MGVQYSTTSVCCLERSTDVKRQPRTLSTCYVDFKKPAEAAQVGGSQVRLFRLVPVLGSSNIPRGSKRQLPGLCSGPEWLGKDVNHCYNEMDFYNEVLHLRRLQQQDPPLQPMPAEGSGQGAVSSSMLKGAPWRIFDFMVSYHGLARSCVCSWQADGKERQRTADLLVFRSPFEGLARPRMLNLELGPRSLALQARPDNEVLSGVLAYQEGIFVDGFLTPPKSLPCEGPTLDLRGWSWGDNIQTRAKRLPLQSLHVSQAITALVDLRAAIAEERLWPGVEAAPSNSKATGRQGKAAVDSFLQHFLSAAEYSELALLALVHELTKLLRACEEVPVPQKWAQSSLALLVEAGVAPPRTGPIHPATWVASRAKVQIFGWSKSRLSLPSSISDDDRQDNELPWKIYQCHVGRVLWETTRLYFHSYCAQEWTELRICIYEASLKGGHVLLGSSHLKLQKPAISTSSLPLHLGDEAVQDALGEASQVVLSATYLPCPEPSNFHGLWQVRIERGQNIPMGERPAGSAAPGIYATVTAIESTSLGSRQSWARTREVARDQPSWEEEFEFPVLKAGSSAVSFGRLLEALGQPVPSDSSTQAILDAAAPGGSLSGHLPALEMHAEKEERSKEDWRGVATSQIAFISELRIGWQNRGCGLIA
eukprot:TRINITY_DN80816_c0_g1_i1.p1 TRINITY_DN80816_c0_g1~~TRINITY_DN80816_c0_g1_i1.p1  ORF type:complete len:651 (+),score=139.94 TRINITY_DN80816_c0_g1_i1:73-2025(+)